MRTFLKSTLPQPLYEKLKHLYKDVVTGYQRDIYSEFGEDFIAAVLLGFQKEGFYVDVGAFRPKELSVTYYFYRKLNWNGIVVEPNVTAVKHFQNQRPRDILVNRGVAGKEGELTYYEFTDPTLNSFSEEAYNTYKESFIGKKSIKVQTLSSLLDEFVPKGKKIDLMNVDVEGLDLEVLFSNDWEKYAPRILIVEDHTFKPEYPLESKIVQLLKEKGYSLKANCLISLVFKKD